MKCSACADLCRRSCTGSGPPVPWYGARAAGVVLRAQEVRQQVLVAPPGAAVLVAPGVVVQPVAADVDHRVHRRGAAEHLAARPVDRAAVGALLRERDVVPVVLAAEEPAVGRGDAGSRRRRWRPAPPRAAAPGCLGPRRAGRPPRSPRCRRPRSRSRTQGYLIGKRGPDLRKPGSGGPPRTAGPRMLAHVTTECHFHVILLLYARFNTQVDAVITSDLMIT